MAQKPLILAVETSGRTGSVAIAFGGQVLAGATFSGPMRHSAEIFPAVCSLLDRFSRKAEEIGHIYISVGPGSFTGLRIAVAMAKTMHLANAAKIVAVDTLDVIAANATEVIAENAVRATSHEPRVTNHEPRATSNEPRITSHEPRITSHEPRVTSHEPRVTSHERIATILDAKRGQFFIAVYQRNTSHGVWQKVLPDSLMTASDFLEQFAAADQPVWLLGEGLVYYKDKFETDGICFLDEKYWRPRAEKVHLLGWQRALAGQFADPLTLTPTYLRCPV